MRQNPRKSEVQAFLCHRINPWTYRVKTVADIRDMNSGCWWPKDASAPVYDRLYLVGRTVKP